MSEASSNIDQRIQELGGWRGETLAKARAAILGADLSVVETWKWNNPVFESHGIICTGEAYKKAVKLTFAHGASLPDPKGLFNSSLEGKVRRAIDFAEGVDVDVAALQDLVRSAIARNQAATKK